MPTQIDSAGITFNDATSLTSANIGTAQLVNGSVTASKLGTNEQKQICKAWVNFNGAIIESGNATSSNTISCNSGSTTGTFTTGGGGWTSSYIGTIWKFTQINGVVGATFGGVNVSTLGVQIISIESSTSATFRFLSGTTTSAQSVTGTGSSASGFSYASTGIRSSYNVSSITKNGTGDYTVNFATPMADANYSSIASCSPSSAPSQRVVVMNFAATSNTIVVPTTSACRFSTTALASGADVEYVHFAAFGN